MALEKQKREEQRKSQRKSTVARCWLADGAVDRYTLLSDLSVSGARVATAGPPPVGCSIALTFRLPESDAEVRASGRVVWRSEGFGGRGGVIGVEFGEVSETRAIAAFVELS